jgi:hypothetical protein
MRNHAEISPTRHTWSSPSHYDKGMGRRKIFRNDTRSCPAHIIPIRIQVLPALAASQAPRSRQGGITVRLRRLLLAALLSS